MPGPDRIDALLIAGMAVGAALAAWSLARDPATVRAPWPDDVVATVSGEPIPRRVFEDAIAALARDRREPLDDDEKRRVLDRLVEEELLVQRGLALGLARSDRKLRGDLVAAVLESIAGQSDDDEPDDGALQAFYESNRGAFGGATTVRVAQVFVAAAARGDDVALDRARDAERRLREGDDVAVVRAALGDPPAVELPAGPLPLARLQDLVGSEAARAVVGLGAGEVSAPLREAGGWRVFVVLAREQAGAATFESLRPAVLREYRRRRAEQAVRERLDALRAAADVQVSPRAVAAGTNE